jgi:hypothetical protein
MIIPPGVRQINGEDSPRAVRRDQKVRLLKALKAFLGEL